MKRFILISSLLSTLFCTACVSQHKQVDNNVISVLKRQTPECRKVYLVSGGLIKGLESMTSNEYILGTGYLCLAYACYEMSQTEINLLSEMSDDYFHNATVKISDNCLKIIEKDGDKAVLSFAKKADEVLQPFVKEHLNQCGLNKGIQLNEQL